ncbi:hypothetical protein BDF20DRAFT_820426 [Mycotypha africana]|uniref:uncharacterized protein n=1 Tax=Mycotypha africana TaxID=64632 RepID=UPI0023018FCB|nr:uncharacterized protein BDF20DRAFT_820426 [Mycotypha africana]KAI8977224.1 hypothetical protein BDF20DRAFT_820426 [Mycotypha africana]
MPSTMQMQSISGIITQIHASSKEVPPALVGASTNIIGNKIYVFAGRLATSRKMTNYLYILDLDTLSWTRHIPPPDSDKPPTPRYFHSASVYQQQLLIFGGMGYSKEEATSTVTTAGLSVLDDMIIFDTETACWKRPEIKPSLYSPLARYAHLSSVTEDKFLVIGGQDLDNNYLDEMSVLNLNTWEWEHLNTFDKHVGAYKSIAVKAPAGARLTATNGTNTINNGSANGSTANMAPIYLYTNYNFADVKRELKLIFPSSYKANVLNVEDYSSTMNGVTMPPGLRFPTGHALGNHLILAGTYLSPNVQAYAIWAFDITKQTWSRIETGNVLNSGSWNRGLLHEKTNRFIVFGNTNRNLLDDYSHRQINFEHIAIVDLEAFGIYSLPMSTCSSLAQEMGLRLLNEPAVSDFYIITQDDMTIPVNSAVLCQRWPYFADLLIENKKKIETKRAASQYMLFPYPYSVVIALLQFIYTDNLLTAQQYQPPILAQLLLLSDMYHLPRLKELATHALHQMLNITTAPLIFETAALSHQTSLQVRALKMMIAAKKMIQEQQLQQQRNPQNTYPSHPFQQHSVLRSRTVSTPVSSSTAPHMDRTSNITPSPSQHNLQRPGSPLQQQTSPLSQDNDNNTITTKVPTVSKPTKEKKKKNAFLGAFSKFSSKSS